MSALTNHARIFSLLPLLALLLGLAEPVHAQFSYKIIRETTADTADALSIVQQTTNQKAVQFRQLIVYCFATGTVTPVVCTVSIERGGTIASTTDMSIGANHATTDNNATAPGFKAFHTSNAGAGNQIGICKSSICPFDIAGLKLDKERSRQYTIRVTSTVSADYTYDIAVDEVTK